MFNDYAGEDYSKSLDELKQDLVLEQLDKIIAALESENSVKEKKILPKEARKKQHLRSGKASTADGIEKDKVTYGRLTETTDYEQAESDVTAVYKRKRHRLDANEAPEMEWDYLMFPRWSFGDKEPCKWDDDKILRARLLLSDYKNLRVNDYVSLEAEYDLYDILNELYEDEDPEENW